MSVFLSEKQKSDLLLVISQVFIQIRALSRGDITEEERNKIFQLSDAFHNLPKLLSEKNVEQDLLLEQINMVDESLKPRLLEILKETADDELGNELTELYKVIEFPCSDEEEKAARERISELEDLLK